MDSQDLVFQSDEDLEFQDETAFDGPVDSFDDPTAVVGEEEEQATIDEGTELGLAPEELIEEVAATMKTGPRRLLSVETIDNNPFPTVEEEEEGYQTFLSTPDQDDTTNELIDGLIEDTVNLDQPEDTSPFAKVPVTRKIEAPPEASPEPTQRLDPPDSSTMLVGWPRLLLMMVLVVCAAATITWVLLTSSWF